MKFRCPKGHYAELSAHYNPIDRIMCAECGTAYSYPEWGYHSGAARDPLLVEREKTHGAFAVTANAAQEIKNAIGKWDVKGLKPVHREVLDMIATKIARILSGNANEPDHFLDIAGYARLGAEACDNG